MYISLPLLQGNSIEAQILKTWIPAFKQQLKEDSVYYIKYFQVVNARTSFRPVEHPYMMRFTAHTKVFQVNLVPDTFPLYACTPITFAILRQRDRITGYKSGTEAWRPHNTTRVLHTQSYKFYTPFCIVLVTM